MSRFALAVLLLLGLSLVANASGVCNAADHDIFKSKGHLFPSVFRAFGGLTVSKRAYEAAVVDAMGLSPACAECYGTAYTCGFDRCFWSCRSAGRTCDACLVSQHCIADVKRCTGFPL